LIAARSPSNNGCSGSADHLRVQRLVAEPHAVLVGEREQPLDAGLDHAACRHQVLAGRRPADEHERVRAQRRGFLHRAPVVVVRAVRGEEPAPAEA
jgi:hypothetical protein